MSNLLALENFLSYVVARQASDTTAKLKDIKVPTLVMVGDDEDHHSSGPTHLHFAKLPAEEIAGAKLVMLPGQGHRYPFVAPEMTNRIIRDFLAESVRPRARAGTGARAAGARPYPRSEG